MSGVYVRDDTGKLEKKVLALLKDAQTEVVKLLKENEEYLLLLSDALIKNAKITEDEVKEILTGLNIEWKKAGELYEFKSVVAEKLKAFEGKQGADFLGLESGETKETTTQIDIEIGD